MKTYLSRANAPFYLWLSSTLTSLFKLSFLYIHSLVVCFALIFVCLLSSFTNPSLASFVGWTSRASELVVVSWQRSTRQMCSPLVNLQGSKTMSKQGNAATTVRLRPTMGLHMAPRLHRISPSTLEESFGWSSLALKSYWWLDHIDDWQLTGPFEEVSEGPW